MFNKKNIISAVILICSIVVSSVSTFAVKGNADEETLQQVKAELQQQINDKSSKLEEKDKQIEELNTKVSEQQSTIDNLNTTVSNLSNSINNTQQDLNNTKSVQKSDKAEVVKHSDEGDSKLQKQIDEVKTANDGFKRDDVIQPDSGDHDKKDPKDMVRD